MGIDPTMLGKVFDLFTQTDRGLARAEGGLGLGLTLVRRLTEMHGGTVTATSPGLGLGSEFIAAPAPSSGSGSDFRCCQTGGSRHAASMPGQRILVVDDKRDSAESLAMLLKLFGNDVRTVHDGRLALEVAAIYRPDIVLLDIGLPGLDGLEVCRCLRARMEEVEPFIVAMTGYGQDEDRRRSRKQVLAPIW